MSYLNIENQWFEILCNRDFGFLNDYLFLTLYLVHNVVCREKIILLFTYLSEVAMSHPSKGGKMNWSKEVRTTDKQAVEEWLTAMDG